MKKLLALLLFVCTAFALTACGSSKIVGEWEFSEMTGKMGIITVTVKAGEEYLGQTLSSEYYTMSFEKDGTGSMTTKLGDYSSSVDFTWEETEEGYKLTSGLSFDVKIVDDFLVFEQDGFSIKLAKK